jgi:TonB-linked SusC/RagA family outer membrane protein
MKKLFLLIVLSVFMCGFTLLAQTKTITGTVTSSAEGEGAIPGVSVSVRGTTIGALTGLDGKYTLNVPQNAAVLVFSYIGMKRQEIEIGTRSVIDVSMEPDILGLDEVVVTALGISREKKALGYTVSDVKSDEINKSKTINPINSLSGKVAGVRINNSTGAVGASTFVEIRGSASLTRNNQPLYIIDGVPMISGFVGGADGVDGVAHKDANTDINPDDIESISVLKGGAATALYGLRAATGAIVITTKKGKAGATQVNFGSSVTMEQISQVPDLQSQYSQGLNGSWSKFNSASWGARIDTLRYTTNPAAFPTNDPGHFTSADEYMAKWDPNGYIVNQSNQYAEANKPVKTFSPYDFFQTGLTFNNNLSVSGGTDKSQFLLSLANTTAEGVIPNNTFNKTNFKVSAEHKFSKQISVGSNLNFVFTDANKIQQGSNTSGVMLGLVRTPPTFDNSYGYIFADGTQRSYRGGTGYDNPYWTANKNSYTETTHRMFGDFHANYTPASWISFTYRFGLDWFNNYYKDYFAIFSCSTPGGKINVANSLNRDLNSDLIMNLHKSFGEFDASLTLGNNIYSSYYEQTRSQANGLILLDFPNMNNTTDNRGYEATTNKRTMAFFGDLSLSYRNMLFATGTIRQEQSTTLPEGNNSFAYPSGSLGFIFTEIGSLKGNKILPYGKLRVSYAITAQDAAMYSTDNYFYSAYFADGWTSPDGMLFPYNGILGYSYTDGLGNTSLKPEKMKTFEVGAELKFINNRISLDAAYFKNTNSDLLMSVPIASSTGFSSQYMNAGKMSTTGIELQVSADVVKVNDFRWNLSVNWSNPKTMVDELAPGVENLFLGGFTGSQIRAVAGYAYRSVYATVWARDDNGNMLINPTGTFKGYPVAKGEMEYIADVQEKWRLGIINTFSFKGITLASVFEIKNGGHMWNGTRGALDYFGTSEGTATRAATDTRVFEGVYGYLDPKTGDVVYTDAAGNDATAPVANNLSVMENNQAWRRGNGSGFQGPSEFYVEKTDWLRLREVTLSYDFPKSITSKLHAQALGLYFTGRNLWLQTDYTGIDPETNLLGASNAQGMDYFNMPGTKSYTFGLKVTF